MELGDPHSVEVRIRSDRSPVPAHRPQLSFLTRVLAPFQHLEDVCVAREGGDLVALVRFSDLSTAVLAQSVLNDAIFNSVGRLSVRFSPFPGAQGPASSPTKLPDPAPYVFQSNQYQKDAKHSEFYNVAPAFSAVVSPAPCKPSPEAYFQPTSSSKKDSQGSQGFYNLASSFSPADCDRLQAPGRRYWTAGINLVPVQTFDTNTLFARSAAVNDNIDARGKWAGWLRNLDSIPHSSALRMRALRGSDSRSVFNSSREVANFFGLFGSLARALYDPSQRTFIAEFESFEHLRAALTRLDLHETCHGLTLDLHPDLHTAIDALQRHSAFEAAHHLPDHPSCRSAPHNHQKGVLGNVLLVWTPDARVHDCEQFGSTLKGEVCRIRRPEAFRTIQIDGLAVPVFHMTFPMSKDAVVVYVRMRGSRVKGLPVTANFAPNAKF